MRLALTLACITILALTAGCSDARTTQVVADDAQAVNNLAAVLPRLPAAQLPAAAATLQAIADQLAKAVGKTIDPTQGALSPAAIKATP